MDLSRIHKIRPRKHVLMNKGNFANIVYYLKDHNIIK